MFRERIDVRSALDPPATIGTVKGFFVTFEGGEGAGKGSVIEALAASLQARGRIPLVTREPGGSDACAAIRRLIVEEGRDWEPLAELLLLMADRAQHVARLIGPALDAGSLVLCDRFDGSSFAYQGAGKGLAVELIAALQSAAAAGRAPDLTILIDVTPEVGLARSRRRLAAGGSNEGRFEALDLAFHRRVRESFLDQAQADPARWFVIDGEQTLPLVIAAAERELNRRLGELV